MKNNNGRLRLLLWMAGSVLVIVGSFATWANARFNGHDARIRDTEQTSAAVRERLDAIQHQLNRMEDKLDERNR